MKYEEAEKLYGGTNNGNNIEAPLPGHTLNEKSTNNRADDGTKKGCNRINRNCFASFMGSE